MKGNSRIFLVEDDETTAFVIQDLLTAAGMQLCHCADGLTAWELLQSTQPAYDVILLDRGLPQMDGMDLLQRIKSTPALAQIPVVMETSQDDRESVHEGLSQGAYYYLTKPFHPEVLLAVVKAALRQSREWRALRDSVRQAERPLSLLNSGVFRFRDLEEGRLLANYLALACPEPERSIQGLQELMVNAVEHGNLQISYAEKGALILENIWQEEVERRLELPEYRERCVEVHFQRLPKSLRFSIQDEGEGFAWEDYLEFSPDRAFDLHGRGIAMAGKLSLDAIEFVGNGNRVIATVKLPPVAASL